MIFSIFGGKVICFKCEHQLAGDFVTLLTVNGDMNTAHSDTTTMTYSAALIQIHAAAQQKCEGI